jgi:hypothetical protein
MARKHDHTAKQKAAPISTLLTKAAFNSSPMTPVVKHPASPRKNF